MEHLLEAYRKGLISLGKLSELFGLPAVETRLRLYEYHISQNNVYSEDDIKNAL